MNEQSIFLAALEITDAAQRASYLDQACAGDPSLRNQVDALLAAHERSGEFLDVPALKQLAAANSADQTRAEHDADDEEIELSFLQASSKSGCLGRLAHYEVQEVVGRGGCGIVLKAFDEKLERIVAIKVMAPELAATSPARKRFLREARATAAIRHENVVSIYAVEELPLPFLVMEYIDGETLQQRLDRTGPLDLREVLRIGQQIAGGLVAAHDKGLIHRDIKPGNILLEHGTDHLKLTDFGLARSADDASMTQSGVIAGTPLYMSPEQAQARDIDQRSDLFSLGSVLYVMCSGRPPFRAATTLAVLKRVVEDQPRPIRNIIPEVPDWLVALINKLHAKNPDERFASAQEVGDLLGRCLSELEQRGRVDLPEEILATLPQPLDEKQDADLDEPPAPALATAKPSARSRGGSWITAASIVLALLAGLGITEATGLTNIGGTVIRLFSPDGTLVVEVDDPGVSVTIDGEEMVITGTGAKEIRLRPGQYKVLASKDGKVLRQELVTVTRDGRQVVRVSRETVPGIAAGETSKTEGPLPPRYTNALGMEFALVPRGKAWLGGGNGVPGDREVEFTEDFYLGVYEVTQDEWKKVMDASPSGHSRTGGYKDRVKDVRDADLQRFPVDGMSWDDTQVFLEALNRREEQEGWVYRLPTEDEWEYACRGGPASIKLDHAYDFYLEKPSNVLLPTQANFKHDNWLNRPCQVGSYPPNRLGLHDMHGNVWEWCNDEVTNEKGETHRPFRGGSFWTPFGDCRAARRQTLFPTGKMSTTGLRVARVRVDADPDRRAVDYVRLLGGKVGTIDDPFRLTLVNLEHCEGVTDEGLAVFRDCENVERLNLRWTDATDAVLVHFKNCRNLMQLELGPTTTDAALAQLPEFEKLAFLNLTARSGQITTDGLMHLRNCKNLSNVTLSWSALTDENAAEVKNWPQVTHLSLLETKSLTDKGLAHLKECKHLRYLRVTETPLISRQMLSELKVALPDCEFRIDGLNAEVPADGDAVREELRRRNPSFNGAITFLVEDGRVVRWSVVDGTLSDLAPILTLHQLKELNYAAFDPERDAPVVRQLTSLEKINGDSAASYRLAYPANKPSPGVSNQWLETVSKLPVQARVKVVIEKLQEQNPNFDGKYAFHEADMSLRFSSRAVTDLSPLKALPELRQLACSVSLPDRSWLADLSPLRDLPLTSLECWHTQVSDLTPLRGKPLTTLIVGGTSVSDLAPLKDMPLTLLNISGTQVEDLSPVSNAKLQHLNCSNTKITDLMLLKGMPLTELNCSSSSISDLSPLKGAPLRILICENTQVSDLSPLEGMPLKELWCFGTRVLDLSPLQGMRLSHLDVSRMPISDLAPLQGLPLTELRCHRTNVADLSPLKGMPLESLWIPDVSAENLQIIRGVDSLKQINGKPAAEFWELKAVP